MCNIYNEEPTFYSWKAVFFFASWYWHIHRFSCFRKEEDQNVQCWQVLVFHFQKKIKRNSAQNLIVPFIKLKSTQKDKILLQCAVSTSAAKHILKGMLVTKGKLKSDVNTIPDLIREEKHVDNNIHIFYLLWGLIWKILKGRYCEDSAWAECLKLYDKKKVCRKIIAMNTDSVIWERCLKWNHLSWLT